MMYYMDCLENNFRSVHFGCYCYIVFVSYTHDFLPFHFWCNWNASIPLSRWKLGVDVWLLHVHVNLTVRVSDKNFACMLIYIIGCYNDENIRVYKLFAPPTWFEDVAITCKHDKCCSNGMLHVNAQLPSYMCNLKTLLFLSTSYHSEWLLWSNKILLQWSSLSKFHQFLER